jgi:hypothetical protein
MASKESYTIEAGSSSRPETVERGNLEKDMGQSQKQGESVQTLLRRADIGIPNWTEAWGVRLDKNGNIPVEPLDIRNPDYKGQIKELNWGDKAGCMIICRYLKGYNTIDMLYQNIILNAAANIREDDPSSADDFYLRLQSGDNFFDPESDKYLVQMLKVHYMNGSSKSRSPESMKQMFKERLLVQNEQAETKTYNDKFDALKIVNEASTDNSLSKLKNLLLIVRDLYTLDEEVKDADLFRVLSMLADTKSELFLSKINEYKKNLSNIFEKAKSYKAIDLTKDGMIVAGTTKQELIGEGIPGKKDGMIDWLMQNYLDQKASDTIFKLKQITDKLN